MARPEGGARPPTVLSRQVTAVTGAEHAHRTGRWAWELPDSPSAGTGSAELAAGTTVPPGNDHVGRERDRLRSPAEELSAVPVRRADGAVRPHRVTALVPSKEPLPSASSRGAGSVVFAWVCLSCPAGPCGRREAHTALQSVWSGQSRGVSGQVCPEVETPAGRASTVAVLVTATSAVVVAAGRVSPVAVPRQPRKR